MEWLKHGCRNTKFYHACANQRRKSNRILVIQDEVGRTWETQEEVRQAFVDYFMGLFMANSRDCLEPCVASIDKRVTTEMNELLLKDYIVEEVCKALHQMSPLKAPSPDGLTAGFYQKNRSTVGHYKKVVH